MLHEDNLHYVIYESCVKCGKCRLICPTGAISTYNDIYKIDPVKCIDCVRSMMAAGKTPHYLADLIFDWETEEMRDSLDEYHGRVREYMVHSHI